MMTMKINKKNLQRVLVGEGQQELGKKGKGQDMYALDTSALLQYLHTTYPSSTNTRTSSSI